MAALDEKQIQEKLYGRYRQGTMPAAEKTSNVKLTPQLNAREERKSAAFFAKPSVLLQKAGGAISGVFKIIPWKILFLIAGCLVISAILFQLILLLVTKSRSADRAEKTQIAQEAALPVEVKTEAVSSKTKAEKTVAQNQVESKVESRSAKEVTAKPTQNEIKQKQYAVQICTYERVQEAQALVDELKALNFPAFFIKTATNHRTLFYVFLDRNNNYSDAKARLAEFRKTSLHQKFQDAFIRSI